MLNISDSDTRRADNSFPRLATMQRTTAVAMATLSLFANACASAPGSIDAGAPAQRTVFAGPDTPTIVSDRLVAVALTVNKPVAATRAAVKAVLTEMEVPVALDNVAARQIGNVDFYKSQRFAKQPIANFLNCGAGMTGPYANSHRIYMSLVSVISDNGKGGSTVQTTYSAAARDMQGGATSDRLPCGSTGAFERLFHDKVAAAAAAMP